MSYEGLQAEVVPFKGHNGDTGEAYYARPTRAGKFPGIVVVMHLPGWDEWIIEVTRKFAAENKLAGFYDSEGICHVVLPERGHLKPGMFVVGGDSHSPTGGAFGAYMFGIGATEMAAAGRDLEPMPVERHGGLVAGQEPRGEPCRRVGASRRAAEPGGDHGERLGRHDRLARLHQPLLPSLCSKPPSPSTVSYTSVVAPTMAATL